MTNTIPHTNQPQDHPTVIDAIFPVGIAWALWGGVYLAICINGLLSHFSRNIDAYLLAAEKWVHGTSLYTHDGVGFIYLPSSAVLYVPFYEMGFTGGCLAWRLFNMSLFAWGIWRLCRMVAKVHHVNLFSATTLLTLPIIWGTAFNGQMTLAMAGCWMIGMADLVERRWWRCAAWLSLGMAIKPLSIVIIGIVSVTAWKQMSWRLTVTVLVAMLFPFLTQSPHYVTQQYIEAWHALHVATTIEFPANDLFGITRALGWDCPDSRAFIVRALAAPLTVFIAWVGWQRLSLMHASLLNFTWAAIYTLLFNARTEGNTYALLAPILGLAAAATGLLERRPLASILIMLGMLAMLLNYEVVYKLTGSKSWAHATVTLLFAIWLARRVYAGISLPRRDAIGLCK
jgi:hypothetical protein